MGCGDSKPKELTIERIAEALGQALELAAANAVALVSKKGGFQDSPKIHIKLPGELGEVMDKCKILPGIGGKVEELEQEMNHAAEQAAGVAFDILVKAIRGMKFEDAKAILDGANDAATQYFIKLTRNDLFASFKPIIDKKLDDLGVITIYDALMTAYGALPFTKAPQYNFNEYVTNQALNGLFQIFADEENKIRGVPENRGDNAAINEVFGSKDKKEEKK